MLYLASHLGQSCSILPSQLGRTAPKAARPPRATRTTPIAREKRTCRTPSFSPKITADRPPIHKRLIEPATNSTSMNSQQHPTQYSECRSPIRKAPNLPDRQCRMTNPIGDVQWVRQTSFVRVTCQSPAATSVAADAKTRTFVIDPMKSRAITASKAATPKAPHVRKYGMTKRVVAALSAGFVGRPSSSRVIPRNARTIGMVEGNIIATIMTTRRAKNRTRSVDAIVEGAIRAIKKSVDVHVTYHAAATTRATATAIGMVMRRKSAVGPTRVASSMRPSVLTVTLRTCGLDRESDGPRRTIK